MSFSTNADYSNLSINVANYKKLAVEFFQSTTLYGGEEGYKGFVELDYQHIKSVITDNTKSTKYITFGVEASSTSNLFCTVYFLNNNFNTIKKISVSGGGSSTDTTFTCNLYGIN